MRSKTEEDDIRNNGAAEHQVNGTVVKGHTSDILEDVYAERERQDGKWGIQRHDDPTWLAILSEEIGESAQEVLQRKFGDVANGHGDLREELVQVAAVAVAWVEEIDRRANA
jgi:NTP pyrophosphatase (non-canonical NTP hydrolase)